MVEVKVPDIGDFKNVDVIEILVKPGDAVAKEQSLVTLESDKATMEIPSPLAGIVKSLIVKIGDKVSEGSPILVLDAIGEGSRATGRRRRRAAPARPRRRRSPPAGAAADRCRRRGRSPARSSCSAPGPAATPPRSAPRTSARTRCSSSATRRSAASA